MYTVYGIKNCDTVKKALNWLDANGVAYSFHDFKSKSVTEQQLKRWCSAWGWEVALNKKGLTWKQLPEESKTKVKSEVEAIKIMMEKTSAIKRPVIEKDGEPWSVGFDQESFEKRFIG